MMTPEKCYEAWKRIIEIYDDEREKSNRPDYTMNRIIEEFGKEDTYTIFSTIAEIKRHDGRIYGRNRDVMNATPFVVECIDFSSRWRLRDTDHIHTAHINNLISELVKL